MSEEPSTEFAPRAKAAWARLIRKICEADPLKCSTWQGTMRVISFWLSGLSVKR